jgi:hypothetical protein
MESLLSAGAGLAELRDPSDFLLIHAHSDQRDGITFTAGNMGLSSYEVAVEIGGTSPEEAGAFAEALHSRLAQIWSLTPIPEGAGALPLPNCRDY